MSRHVVTLDEVVAEDWPAVHSWACLAEVCRYQGWGPNTEEETREFVREAAEAWASRPRYRLPYVARVGTEAGAEAVGMGELHVHSRSRRHGEIRYVVHPRFWGQGIATEIGRQLLSRGFDDLGLHRIHATCDPRNTGSSRVLTKLGMTYEGRLRHTALIRDGWRDDLVFSLLEDEWRTALGRFPPEAHHDQGHGRR